MAAYLKAVKKYNSRCKILNIEQGTPNDEVKGHFIIQYFLIDSRYSILSSSFRQGRNVLVTPGVALRARQQAVGFIVVLEAFVYRVPVQLAGHFHGNV